MSKTTKNLMAAFQGESEARNRYTFFAEIARNEGYHYIAKALALGADAVAIGTAALMAIGCQQYRICNTGKCPMGIATQDPTLRRNLSVNKSARKLENFLNATANELRDFARLTGRQSIHDLSVTDLCTVNSEISNHTPIEHV